MRKNKIISALENGSVSLNSGPISTIILDADDEEWSIKVT
jgi:hypothetical protein